MIGTKTANFCKCGDTYINLSEVEKVEYSKAFAKKRTLLVNVDGDGQYHAVEACNGWWNWPGKPADIHVHYLSEVPFLVVTLTSGQRTEFRGHAADLFLSYFRKLMGPFIVGAVVYEVAELKEQNHDTFHITWRRLPSQTMTIGQFVAACWTVLTESKSAQFPGVRAMDFVIDAVEVSPHTPLQSLHVDGMIKTLHVQPCTRS